MNHSGDRARVADLRSSPVLEMQGVTKHYRQGDDDVVAVSDADLLIHAGEFVALVGPSGSGKSTLLHMAGGLDEPDAGSVRVCGEDLAQLGGAGRARVRRREVGFVFQFFQLIPSLTVCENVELPLVFDRVRDSARRALEALRSMGLDSKTSRYPAELSGGEMQRVAIARALVTRPKLILADEPTGNLDSVTGSAVLELFTAEVRGCGAALLLVTHDDRAALIADRLLKITDGHLAQA